MCAAALAALIGPAGCSGRSSSTLAAATNPTPVTTPPATTTAAIASKPCAPRPNPAPGPVTDPNGPMFHQVVIARTADGLNLVDARIVQSAASVPDGVRTADGRTLVYYVNGAQHGVWVGAATATSLAPIGPVSIDEVPDPLGIVDPDAYRVGSRVRLAYLSGFTSGERAICLADSEDGISFRSVGLALDLRGGETITDPSVVQLTDGTWLMALSAGQNTLLARSVDGLSFQLGERLTYGGVPELALLPGGSGVRLYVCAGGIVAYRSADTTSWQREQVVVTRGPNGSLLVCDPSVVAGTELFVFKTGM